MNSPKIRFLYFLEYWPIPFGVLQTCCKIQKCKKINFLLCLRNPCENTFSKLQMFFYIYIYIYKNVQNMLEYWPYETHKKTFFWYICEFVALRQKPGILNTRLIFFDNIKKIQTLKQIYQKIINLFLFLFFEKKKGNETSRSGHKKNSATVQVNYNSLEQ
jgi:hypothetical protein